MTAEFEQHHNADLLRSVPGLGSVLAAPVLAEIGDDTSRFATPGGLRAFAGTAPITKASGRSKIVRTRHIKNKRQVAVLLVELGVARSHSRPHVSNDNPYPEAVFKTLKYCPAFRTDSGPSKTPGRSVSAAVIP